MWPTSTWYRTEAGTGRNFQARARPGPESRSFGPARPGPECKNSGPARPGPELPTARPGPARPGPVWPGRDLKLRHIEKSQESIKITKLITK